jgi:hypothetical protein
MTPPALSKAEQLARRRQQLLLRSGELRQQLSRDAQVLAPWLGAADGVRSASAWLQRHPEWVAAAVATLVVLKPRRVLSLGLKGWSGWKMWQRARATWAGVSRP